MSLKSFIALADDKLTALFNRVEPKAPDFTKARKAALKSIETTKKQFVATEPSKGKKRFKINNSVVKYVPGFLVNSKSELVFPSERFVEALDHLAKAIGAGELDKELSEAKTAPKASTTTRKTRTETPEAKAARIEKAKATRAANKAKK